MIEYSELEKDNTVYASFVKDEVYYEIPIRDIETENIQTHLQEMVNICKEARGE